MVKSTLPLYAKTAIARTKLSAPMAYLVQQDLLCGRCLDYGCGRGTDADRVNAIMYRYDPYWHPYTTILTKGFFQTITCNYVLNTIAGPIGRQDVINRIASLLRPGGKAYISVRADIKEDGFTKSGSFQGNVFLNLPLIKKTKSFRMYVLDKTGTA